MKIRKISGLHYFVLLKHIPYVCPHKNISMRNKDSECVKTKNECVPIENGDRWIFLSKFIAK